MENEPVAVPPRHGLSKSRIAAFEQCPKRLWLQVHRPDLVDRRRPHTEAQLLWVNFIDRGCGDHTNRPEASAVDNDCARFNATLNRLDWPTLFKALGW